MEKKVEKHWPTKKTQSNKVITTLASSSNMQGMVTSHCLPFFAPQTANCST